MEYCTTILGALALVALLFARQLITIWKFLRVAARIPTNKCGPIFGHIIDLMVPPDRLLQTFERIKNENEPLFKIWMVLPAVVMTKPEHIEAILGSSKHIDKSIQYILLKSWLGTGLLTSTGSKWHLHRKMLTPAFHFKILENFVDVFSDKCRILVEKLEKEIESDNFAVLPYISMCTLDIICATAMGVEINAQEHGEHSEYVVDVTNITNEISRRTCAPLLYPDFIYYCTPAGRSLKKYITKMHNFTIEVIQKRKKLFKPQRENMEFQDENDIVMGIKKKLTFLDLLLQTSNDGAVLTDEEIREEVDTFMLEGHDTTAAGISWTLHMLGSHPDIQEKAHEELEDIFQGSDRSPTMEDLNAMKYLERVIKETLRLYPSVPIIGRRVEEDVTIDGIILPGGIDVILLIYFTHRDPEHFADPEKFDPDNFLPERVAARHPYAYIPFSAGPRNCIGQKFALLEMKTVLSYILRHYKLQSVGKTPALVSGLILRPDNGIRLKITRR